MGKITTSYFYSKEELAKIYPPMKFDKDLLTKNRELMKRFDKLEKERSEKFKASSSQ